MPKTNLVVLGDNDNLIHQEIIASLKDSPEYIIVYVNGKDMCGKVSAAISEELEGLGLIGVERNFSTGVYESLADLQRRFLEEVEVSGFKVYNDFVDIPDDVSDNKQICGKHNKPFYQKGRW